MKKTDFYQSKEWAELKRKAYKRYGRQCMATGLTEKDGITLSVDHIKPRSKAPHLALKLSNVQVLELGLNKTKSNRANWDFRPWQWKLYYRIIKMTKDITITTIGVAFLFLLAMTEPWFYSLVQSQHNVIAPHAVIVFEFLLNIFESLNLFIKSLF